MGKRGVRQEVLYYVDSAWAGSGRLVRKEREAASSRNGMRKEVLNIDSTDSDQGFRQGRTGMP